MRVKQYDPTCFSYPLDSGLNIVNFVILGICLCDLLFVLARNGLVFEAGFLFGPVNLATSWVILPFGVVTAMCGFYAVSLSPSSKKGVMIKTWKYLILGFMIVYAFYKSITVYSYAVTVFESGPVKALSEKLVVPHWVKKLGGIYLKQMWLENMSLPNAMVMYISLHPILHAYISVILPIFIVSYCISYINQYLEFTRDGELSMDDGLEIIKKKHELIRGEQSKKLISKVT
jgi:hypothetical protein